MHLCRPDCLPSHLTQPAASVTIEEVTIELITMKNISRNPSFLLPVLVLVLAIGLGAAANDAVNPALRPPKGAQVAIVVFEDLQCPQCRRVAPILKQASKTYKIPVVRHDFPFAHAQLVLPGGGDGALFRRDVQGAGQRFPRLYFSNQLEINPQNLHGYADKFASEHKVHCRL